MTATEIREKIIEICRETLGLDFAAVGPEHDATPIYSKPFALRPYMHLILALELQRAYDIQYTEEQLMQYGLFTINDMVNTVMESLKRNR